MHRAVFLDRDGTLIVEKHYLHKVEDVSIPDSAAPALKRLQDAGFKLFIISNQSGVGRGFFTLADVGNVNAHIQREFARHGVRFEKIYIAPERPDQPARGRKPSPQFVFDARDEFHLDLAQSYFIGDRMADMECGWNAGVRKSILLRTGYGAEVERTSAEKLKAALVVNDLPDAVDWILGDAS